MSLFFNLVSFSFDALKVIECHDCVQFIGLAYQGKDIVFRFSIVYSSFRDFGPKVVGLFLYEDILYFYSFER